MNYLMEFCFPSFSTFVSFLLFIFIVLKLRKRANANGFTSKLPPGPRKLPLIGNIHQLGGSVPHRVLWDLATKYGPLMHLQLGEVSTVIVSSPEFAKEVMKTHDITFASRPEILASRIMNYGSTGLAFLPYGDYWRQLRKICTLELLSVKRVESFSPIRKEEMENLIKWISTRAGSQVNLTEKMISLSYTITSRAAFGAKYKGQDQFIALIKEATKEASGFSIPDLYPSLKILSLISTTRYIIERLHKEADEILENIVDEHRKGKAAAEAKMDGNKTMEDLVDVLLKFEGQNELEFSVTTDNIKAVVMDIFGGGGETSASTVIWAMAEMIRNPRVMEKAQAEVRQVFGRRGGVKETDLNELSYLNSVIKETLRLHPPAPLLLPRECSEKCQIGGYDIPLKTKVIINAWVLGRDPQYWNDPETFYPERFSGSSVDFKGSNFEFIPFGAGRRKCPGMSFGLINVELQLAVLLYHFDWKLPNAMKHEDLDMSEAFGITAQRKDDLCLIPVPYHC